MVVITKVFDAIKTIYDTKRPSSKPHELDHPRLPNQPTFYSTTSDMRSKRGSVEIGYEFRRFVYQYLSVKGWIDTVVVPIFR